MATHGSLGQNTLTFLNGGDNHSTLTATSNGVSTFSSLAGLIDLRGIKAIPDQADSAASKIYVDGLVSSGISWKEAARLATDGNEDQTFTYDGTSVITVSGGTGDEIDGTVVVNGDRVVMKDMATLTTAGTNPTQGNGIYVVSAVDPDTSFTMTRSEDAAAGDSANGAAIFIYAGDAVAPVNNDTTWVVTSDATVDFNDVILFAQMSTAPVLGALLKDHLFAGNASGNASDAGVNLLYDFTAGSTTPTLSLGSSVTGTAAVLNVGTGTSQATATMNIGAGTTINTSTTINMGDGTGTSTIDGQGGAMTLSNTPASAVNLYNTTTGTITAFNASTGTINLAAGATASTINMGSSTTTAINILSTTTDVDGTTLNLGDTTATDINIGSSSASTVDLDGISIVLGSVANSTSTTLTGQDVNVGSSTTTTTNVEGITITSGTTAVTTVYTTQTTIGGTASLFDSTTTGVITMGAGLTTGDVTIGNNSPGTGNVASLLGETVNVGGSGTTTSNLLATGAGGVVNITSGADTAGGAITLTTGAGTAGAGGAFVLNVGAGDAGAGGAIDLNAGAGTTTTDAGGEVTINAGAGAISGAGGAVSITSGAGGGTTGDAGDVTITSGVAAGAGTDGALNFNVAGVSNLWPIADAASANYVLKKSNGTAQMVWAADTGDALTQDQIYIGNDSGVATDSGLNFTIDQSTMGISPVLNIAGTGAGTLGTAVSGVINLGTDGSGNVASTINMGKGTGAVTLDAQATNSVSLFDTVAGGSITAFGAATGTVSVANSTAMTLNVGGAATALNLGASAVATNVSATGTGGITIGNTTSATVDMIGIDMAIGSTTTTTLDLLSTGTGGTVAMTAGAGSASAGGAIAITTGAGEDDTAAGGAVSITTGVGGTATSPATAGGVSGGHTHTVGAGGVGFGTGAGGAGGVFAVAGGVGGVSGGGATGNGGAGSNITFTSGVGGASVATSGTGGLGGSITLQAAVGGAGTLATGASGNIVLKTSETASGSASQSIVQFQNSSSTEIARVEDNGDFYGLSFNATSDARYKTNISRLDDPLRMINGIEGYSYNWREDFHGNSDILQYGVLAQQLETVGLNHLVTGTEDSKAVNYIGLIPILIEAVKELSEKVDNYENPKKRKIASIATYGAPTDSERKNHIKQYNLISKKAGSAKKQRRTRTTRSHRLRTLNTQQ
jgi:hypothetical protein